MNRSAADELDPGMRRWVREVVRNWSDSDDKLADVLLAGGLPTTFDRKTDPDKVMQLIREMREPEAGDVCACGHARRKHIETPNDLRYQCTGEVKVNVSAVALPHVCGCTDFQMAG